MNSQFDSRPIANFKRLPDQMHASKGVFAEFSQNGVGFPVLWAAAYKDSPWPRFREITLKSLHDDHSGRLAW
jgi:hypothetical protein